MRILRRFWPLVLLLAALVAIWASGLMGQLNWATLARNQAALDAWVTSHPIAAPAVYMAIYAVTVFLLLPESAMITVAGGLLFGAILGGTLALVGSSAGAILLFLAVRYHLADAIAARGSRFVELVRASVARNGFSFLLAIRLIPVFPFWLVNLAGALSGMRLLPYATATVVGAAPATFVFASIGAGVGDVLQSGGTPDLRIIFSPRILGPLLALAALALLSIVWRRRRRRTDA
jgi:uncharacterized membrane protein YdjX (TVP38/TMEM64 family)